MAHQTTVMVSSTLKTIAVMTLVTSVLWTAIAIYGAANKQPEAGVSAEVLAPIDPAIDMETIKSLQARRQIEDEAGTEEVIRAALKLVASSPTPQPTSQPVAAPATPEDETAL